MTDEEYLKFLKKNCPYCRNNYEHCNENECQGEYETAEEMFKKLGFEKYLESKYYITFLCEYTTITDIITFYKKEKSYRVVEYSAYGDKYGRPIDIYLELYKAITKQMEELNWI